MNQTTISSGSLIESAERAAAPHEGSRRKSGGVEGRKAPATAEADGRSGRTRCLSAILVASVDLVGDASF